MKTSDMSKDLRKIVRKLMDSPDWRVRETRHGLWFMHSSGATCATHGDASDVRVLRQFRGDVRRIDPGLDL